MADKVTAQAAGRRANLLVSSEERRRRADATAAPLRRISLGRDKSGAGNVQVHHESRPRVC